MKRIALVLTLSISFIFIVGCSAADQRYEENMELALEQIENDNLLAAKDFFEKALVEKPEDEKAQIYLNQITAFIAALDYFNQGELADAKAEIEIVIQTEDGLASLIVQAEEIQEEIVTLEDDYERYRADYKKSQTALEDKDFATANELLQTMEENDLTHPLYKTLQEDIAALKVAVSEAEKKEEALKKAEEERIAKEKAEKAAEEERLAREKAEQEKVAAQGVGLFKGYWLKDTMACHFTDTYAACAMAESDFITYDEFAHTRFISNNEIEITFHDNTTVTHRLIDDNTLELGDGLYHRVSAEAANAIYAGQYTLP